MQILIAMANPIAAGRSNFHCGLHPLPSVHPSLPFHLLRPHHPPVLRLLYPKGCPTWVVYCCSHYSSFWINKLLSIQLCDHSTIHQLHYYILVATVGHRVPSRTRQKMLLDERKYPRRVGTTGYLRVPSCTGCRFC